MINTYLKWLTENQEIRHHEIQLGPYNKSYFYSLPNHDEITHRSYGTYYSLLYDEKKIGIVGFIPLKTRGEVLGQILIHPNFRGKQILQTAYDLLSKKHKIKKLFVTILDENISSIKGHLKAGFVKVSSEQDRKLRKQGYLYPGESRYEKIYK